jgi:dTDP-4-amino-4,6-dideoxygalactose transaminase
VYHLFPVATPLRDELATYLASRHIDSGIHYPVPLHLQPAFAALDYREGQMPMAERIGKQELSLPIGPMMSDEQVEQVCDAIIQFFREH